MILFRVLIALLFVSACTQGESPEAAKPEGKEAEKVAAVADTPAQPEDTPADKAEPAEPEAEDKPTIERTPSVEGAKVFFVRPRNKAKVKSPVKIVFGLKGMKVAKAGDESAESGHHHLIVDAELPPLDAPIPATENYIHFGDGSTSTKLKLSKGKHKLQLLLGDYRHIPHDPPVKSEVITITVK